MWIAIMISKQNKAKNPILCCEILYLLTTAAIIWYFEQTASEIVNKWGVYGSYFTICPLQDGWLSILKVWNIICRNLSFDWVTESAKNHNFQEQEWPRPSPLHEKFKPFMQEKGLCHLSKHLSWIVSFSPVKKSSVISLGGTDAELRDLGLMEALFGFF